MDTSASVRLSEQDYAKTFPAISLNLVGLFTGWLHGIVVERRSLAGELSLSCARPADDG